VKNSCKSRNGVAFLVGLNVLALALSLEGPTAEAQNAEVGPPANVTSRQPARQAGTAQPAAAHAVLNSGKRYFIEFRSRAAASYGHTYVVLGRLNARGEIAEYKIAGLHPAGDREDCENCSLLPWLLGHIVPVPAETGASDGDLEEEYVTARYRIMLSEAEYRKVAADIKQLQAKSAVWHAFLINCNAFGAEVAQTMGLQTPFWVQYPAEFINTLREMNGGGPPPQPLKDVSKTPKKPWALTGQAAEITPRQPSQSSRAAARSSSSPSARVMPPAAQEPAREISHYQPSFDGTN
jgi:hypothetical protein